MSFGLACWPCLSDGAHIRDLYLWGQLFFYTFFIFFNLNTMTYRESGVLGLLQEIPYLDSVVFWVNGAKDTVIHATLA